MFANLALLPLTAFAMQVPIVTIPLQKTPRQVARPIAPIEEWGPKWAEVCGESTDWDKPAPPVRIHGNTFLVGTCGISAILVTGTDGHILIDAGTEKGADLIADNIRHLGFVPSEVRIHLHSHEHHDHVGGMARLQQLSGGRLMASAPAAEVFATGAASGDDPQAGLSKPFPAARVDRIVKDGDTIRLGNLQLTAIATPGHTAGAMSWRWESCDGGVCRTMVYADSLTPVSRDDYRFGDHSDVVATFRASIAKIADSRCEILLTPHPGASAMKERMVGEKALFDPEGCKAYAAALTRRLDERLAKEIGK